MSAVAPPECSVIVCVRNGVETLGVQLRALAAQVDPPSFEVLVVDNGSTDATAEVYRRWASADIGSVSSTRLIPAWDRVGIAYARNVGASHARGKILAYCDADDKVAPTWLRAAYDALNRHSWEAVSGPILRLSPGGVTSTDVVMDSLDGIGARRGAAREVPYFWGCSFAMTRKAFDAVGGFDEGLPPYGCDDVDIGIRLAEHALHIGFAPQMTLYYSLPSGVSRRLRRKSRAGVAEACVWARHPQTFGRRTLTRVAADAGREIRSAAQTRGTARSRLLRSMEIVAAHTGQIWGMYAWVRSGRLGPPRYFAAEKR